MMLQVARSIEEKYVQDKYPRQHQETTGISRYICLYVEQGITAASCIHIYVR